MVRERGKFPWRRLRLFLEMYPFLVLVTKLLTTLSSCPLIWCMSSLEEQPAPAIDTEKVFVKVKER